MIDPGITTAGPMRPAVFQAGGPAIPPDAAELLAAGMAALAVGLAVLGAGIAERGLGAAAIGAIAEDQDLFGV